MQRVLNISLIISGLVAAWVALLASVMALTDAAPGAMVLFPSRTLLTHLPDEAVIIDAGQFTVTLRTTPGLTQDLYAAGAMLVLPAGLTGCLLPPEAFRS